MYMFHWNNSKIHIVHLLFYMYMYVWTLAMLKNCENVDMHTCRHATVQWKLFSFFPHCNFYFQFKCFVLSALYDLQFWHQPESTFKRNIENNKPCHSYYWISGKEYNKPGISLHLLKLIFRRVCSILMMSCVWTIFIPNRVYQEEALLD